jgi:peptidoglycan/LPS O-acetylase OafA/YrhL
LVWPWIILFVRRKYLVPLTLLAVASAPILRLVLMLSDVNLVAVLVITPSNLDSLGMGAMLALLSQSPDTFHKYGRRLVAAGLWLGLPLCTALVIVRLAFGWNPIYVNVGLHTSMALFYIWLIHQVSGRTNGVLGKILECKPIVYVGKISYGVYIYHLFAFALVTYVVEQFGLWYPFRGADIIIWTAATVALAAPSWHFFERPILKLKRYLRYTRDRATSAE